MLFYKLALIFTFFSARISPGFKQILTFSWVWGVDRYPESAVTAWVNEDQYIRWLANWVQQKGLQATDLVLFNHGLHLMHTTPLAECAPLSSELFDRGYPSLINRTVSLFSKPTLKVYRTTNYLGQPSRPDWAKSDKAWRVSFAGSLARCTRPK